MHVVRQGVLWGNQRWRQFWSRTPSGWFNNWTGRQIDRFWVNFNSNHTQMMIKNYEIYTEDRGFHKESRTVGIFWFGARLIGEPVESSWDWTGQSQPGQEPVNLDQSTEPERIWLEFGLGSGSKQCGKRLGRVRRNGRSRLEAGSEGLRLRRWRTARINSGRKWTAQIVSRS